MPLGVDKFDEAIDDNGETMTMDCDEDGDSIDDIICDDAMVMDHGDEDLGLHENEKE